MIKKIDVRHMIKNCMQADFLNFTILTIFLFFIVTPSLFANNENSQSLVQNIAVKDDNVKSGINGEVRTGFESAAQQGKRTITGKVTDGSTGEVLIGATIVVKGTTQGVITDIDGNYTIDCNDGDVLSFSFIGYASVDTELGSTNKIDVVLESDAKNIEEVIAIGYGTTTRKKAVGAVDQVTNELIENRPVANVSQALQGTSPSLTIQQRSMNPNDNSMNINIRGVSSLNNNNPLVVIDGMVTNDVSAMNNLNPNDIESVSVLKDAGTAAIYGSRSANGVILITTKKGKKNMAPVVSLNASVGTQNPDILLEPLTGWQNALLRNDSYVNAGRDAIYTPEQIEQFAQGDSEWGYDAIMQNALQQSYNLSVQGGSESTNYNISFGYYDQESNLKGRDYGIDKYNFRTNLVTDVGKLKINTILAYDRQDGQSVDDERFSYADGMRVPVYNTYDIYPDEDGKYYNNEVVTEKNILGVLNNGGYNESDNDHLQAMVSGEIDIWKGLKARAVLGYDLTANHNVSKRVYFPVYSYSDPDRVVNSGDELDNRINDYSSKSTLLNTQFLLDYNRTFNEKHNVTALFGYTSESYRSEGHRIYRRYVDPDLFLDTDNTVYMTDSHNTNTNTVERALNSWLGRAGYNYMEKYYAEVSARYDGSSRFSSDYRWGFFPSVSAGWRMTEENFLTEYKYNVGDLKLRGSYGILGSQAVDDYQYLTTYSVYSNIYSYNNELVTGTGFTFGNEALSWEKAATLNLGLDASFFNNSLRATFDYFNKVTSDILLTPQTPSTLGGAIPKENRGKMRNRGWEITINYNLRHGDFNHSFGFNIGDTRNEVLEYGDTQIDSSDEIERIIQEGLPLYSYYGYKTDGLYQTQEEIDASATFAGVDLKPGDVKYVDRNGDGVIDDNDRYVLGNAFPRYTYGFNYALNWKNFDFSMMWQGVGKRDMALRGEMVEPFHSSYYYTMFEHQLDYWTPGNTDAKYPRLINNAASSSYTNNYGKGSDLNIYDAAYLRLKDIQIGYTLPKNITERVNIGRMRIYLSGQNLLTFTKNSFIDPESSEFGNSMNASGANSGRSYPTLKYYGGGIDLEF